MGRTRVTPLNKAVDGPVKTLLTKRKTIEGRKSRLYSDRLNQPVRKSRNEKRKFIGSKNIKIWKPAIKFLNARHTNDHFLFRHAREMRVTKQRIAAIQDKEAAATAPEGVAAPRVAGPPARPSVATRHNARLALVFRVKSRAAVPAPLHRLLVSQYGLAGEGLGAFVWHDASAAAALHAVNSAVRVCYPTQQQAYDMLVTRGACIVNARRAPLSDNVTVETALGTEGILSIGDLAFSLANGGALPPIPGIPMTPSPDAARFAKLTAFLAPIAIKAAPLDIAASQLEVRQKRTSSRAKKVAQVLSVISSSVSARYLPVSFSHFRAVSLSGVVVSLHASTARTSPLVTGVVVSAEMNILT